VATSTGRGSGQLFANPICDKSASANQFGKQRYRSLDVVSVSNYHQTKSPCGTGRKHGGAISVGRSWLQINSFKKLTGGEACLADLLMPKSPGRSESKTIKQTVLKNPSQNSHRREVTNLARLRGHRVEAARPDVPLRLFQSMAQGQEPGGAGGTT
jgi:hypothetical protein